MKHLFLLMMMLIFSMSIFAQTVPDPVPDDPVVVVVDKDEQPANPIVAIVDEGEQPANQPDKIFETFFTLVAFIPIVVQFLRKLIIPNSKGLGVQIFSWVIGIAITIIGWLLHLGFLDGISIWLALLYGAGASLAANGVFDTGIITAIFSLFEKKTST